MHTGVITALIAAHAADLVRGVPGAWEWDHALGKARKELDWEAQMKLAIDPALARKKRGARNEEGVEACSMCGNYCSVKLLGQYFEKPAKGHC